MTQVAVTMERFFSDRLVNQRQVSPRTIASYRDSLKLLVGFVHEQTRKAPSDLDWEDLGPDTICAFLDHLETHRRNSARTRNLRLTAIRSLFIYASLRHPEHAALIARVLAIPPKRFDKTTITFLTEDELDVLISAPDQSRWEGRRDQALLLVAADTGLRVSELTGLNCGDVTFGDGACVRCEGKGRRERAVPLSRPAEIVVKQWATERSGRRDEPLFPTRTGRRLSADAVQRLIHKHATTAATRCPTIRPEKLHPHTLRHSRAMSLLRARVDTAVIALWLGHSDRRSTDTYLHADMTIKQRALELTKPRSVPAGRYRPPDRLLAFLESL